MAECTYSLDGEHHFGERRRNGVREIGCRCGLLLVGEAADQVRAQLAATDAEIERQRELSRSMVRQIMRDQDGDQARLI